MTAPPETIPGKAALLGIRYDASSSFQRGPAEAPPRIREALWSPAGNPWTEAGVDLGAGLLCDEGDLAPEPGREGAKSRPRSTGSSPPAGRRWFWEAITRSPIPCCGRCGVTIRN